MTRCPNCGHTNTRYKATRTERWGYVIDIEIFGCQRCGEEFEQRA